MSKYTPGEEEGSSKRREGEEPSPLGVKRKVEELSPLEPSPLGVKIMHLMPDASPEFKDNLLECLEEFLKSNDVGEEEEDAILLIEPTSQMDQVNGAPAPGTNRTAVIAAVNAYATMDIGGLGVAFLFASHDELSRAKQELGNGKFAGNVQWAFVMGPGTLQVNNVALALVGQAPLPAPLPCANTQIITFYSHATGDLKNDIFDFFTY